MEEQILAMGIKVVGKEKLPICGELTPGRVQKALFGGDVPTEDNSPDLPPRPPNMCPGCPHRNVFHALNRLKAYVTGDIGCYTLGFMPPLSAMVIAVLDSCLVNRQLGLTGWFIQH